MWGLCGEKAVPYPKIFYIFPQTVSYPERFHFMSSNWLYFEGVGWLHLSGHVSSTICLAPSTWQRPINDLFLFSVNLSVQYEILGTNMHIKIPRRPSPRTFRTHQIKGRVWLSPLDPIQRWANNTVMAMAPTHLSSDHPVCASRDRQAENSQLSQELQLCLDPIQIAVCPSGPSLCLYISSSTPGSAFCFTLPLRLNSDPTT